MVVAALRAVQKWAALLAFLLFCAVPASAVDMRFQILPGDRLSFTERADLRRYEDGRFVGLSFREVRGILQAEPGQAPEARICGDFYVFEETKHNNRHVAKRIEAVIPVSFTILPGGLYRVEESQAYPALRSFPVFPDGPVERGESWRGYGVRVVEPLRDGAFTRVRFYCEYRYLGPQLLEGREYEVVSAKYALRYRRGDDPYGDERIRRISGSHVVTIYYDSILRRPFFMRDQMHEEYELEDERGVAFKGFVLTWFDDVVKMDRPRLAEDLRRELEASGVEDVDVAESTEGVALTLNRIHFVADQAVVLPEEGPRLEALAQTLKKIEKRSFLVVGHTARVGSEESQYSLSVERAKTIVDYLVSRGIAAERFFYEGRGGNEPVAPNDTEENMARNRRVEIVILED
jgi:OOP family OmpA-OmpF porin